VDYFLRLSISEIIRDSTLLRDVPCFIRIKIVVSRYQYYAGILKCPKILASSKPLP